MVVVSTRCRPFTDFGGMEKWSIALCNALSLKDEVCFITGEGIFLIKNRKNEKIKSYLSSNSISSILKVNYQTYKIIKKNKVQSFHIFGHVGIAALYLLKSSIFKSRFYGLGYECVFNEDKSVLKKIKNYVHRFLMRLTISKVDISYVLERARIPQIAKFFVLPINKVRSIENFIDNKNIASVPNFKVGEKKIVLSIGRDCDAKRRKNLIQDWEELYKNDKDYCLKIISKNLDQNLLKQINKIENIEYLDNISDKELEQIRTQSAFDVSYSNQKNPLLVSLESISYGCIPVIDEKSDTSYFNKSNSVFLKDLDNLTYEISSEIFNNCYEKIKERSLQTFEDKIISENF